MHFRPAGIRRILNLPDCRDDGRLLLALRFRQSNYKRPRVSGLGGVGRLRLKRVSRTRGRCTKRPRFTESPSVNLRVEVQGTEFGDTFRLLAMRKLESHANRDHGLSRREGIQFLHVLERHGPRVHSLCGVCLSVMTKFTTAESPASTLMLRSQVLGSLKTARWLAFWVKTSTAFSLPSTCHPSCQATTS
jgi:hypothetical protein